MSRDKKDWAKGHWKYISNKRKTRRWEYLPGLLAGKCISLIWNQAPQHCVGCKDMANVEK